MLKMPLKRKVSPKEQSHNEVEDGPSAKLRKTTARKKEIKTEKDTKKAKVTKEKGGAKLGKHLQAKSREYKKAEKIDEPKEENAEPKHKKRTTKQSKELSDEPKTLVNTTTTNWQLIDFTNSKKNAEKETHNLKISCWNIGSLNSWVKKGCMMFLDHEVPDILCLQEIKCSEDKIPKEILELKGYYKYWCTSQKKGYAGVGLFTNQEPLEVTYGIGVPELDEDGRCITAEFDGYYVVGVYVPNAGRGLVTLPKRLKWNKVFKEHIQSLDAKKPVIIVGDMNVAHKEIDLARPKTNTKNAGFTPEEREGMTDFLNSGFVDTFRELYPEKTDAYTFWQYMNNARSKNIGWRLDYFIVSERIKGKVCDSVIRSEVFGSDHCPITLFLNI